MTLQTQIVYVIGAILLLYILKPILLFKPNGKPRLYGLGYDEEGYKKTLYTFQFVIIIIVLVVTLYIKNQNKFFFN
jgi:hypothetical protein